MIRSFLISFSLLVCASTCARAQMMIMTQQQLNFPNSKDCPIEQPFSPKPERVETNAEGTTIVLPMNGYTIHRMELKGLETPTDIEITWIPNEEPEKWGTKTATLSIESSDQCHAVWFFAPDNVPTKQIEIRSHGKLDGLTIAFSDKTWDHEGTCPARSLCPALVANGKRCEGHPHSHSCDAFLGLFKKLSETEECRRSVDFLPVPGLWVCEETTQRDDAFSGSINVLKLLKKRGNKEAAAFYDSPEFRRTLDGAYLEDYFNGRDTPARPPSYYEPPDPKNIAKWRDNEKALLKAGYTELSGSDAVRFLTGNTVVIRGRDTPTGRGLVQGDDRVAFYYFNDQSTAYHCAGFDCWTSRWTVDEKDICFESVEECREPKYKTLTAPRVFKAPHSKTQRKRIGIYLTNKFIMHSVVRGNTTIAPLLDTVGKGEEIEVDAKDFAQQIEASSKFSGGDQAVPISGHQALSLLIGNTFISDETATDKQGKRYLCPRRGLYYSADGRFIRFDCDSRNDRWSMHVLHWERSKEALYIQDEDGTLAHERSFAQAYLTPSEKKDVWHVVSADGFPVEARMIAYKGNLFHFR